VKLKEQKEIFWKKFGKNEKMIKLIKVFLYYRKTRLNPPYDRGKSNFWRGEDYGVKIENEGTYLE
jgi:hypothetical protein